MMPDIDLQLKVVVKALRDVVGPAVDPNNKVAVEQLQLSIASVQMATDRLPHYRGRIRQELVNAMKMASRVGELVISAQLETAVKEAQSTLLLVDSSNEQLASMTDELLSLVAVAVDEVAAADIRKKIGVLVIGHTKAQTDLARSWCANSGFEIDPESIPHLSNLIDLASARPELASD